MTWIALGLLALTAWLVGWKVFLGLLAAVVLVAGIGMTHDARRQRGG